MEVSYKGMEVGQRRIIFGSKTQINDVFESRFGMFSIKSNEL